MGRVEGGDRVPRRRLAACAGSAGLAALLTLTACGYAVQRTAHGSTGSSSSGSSSSGPSSSGPSSSGPSSSGSSSSGPSSTGPSATTPTAVTPSGTPSAGPTSGTTTPSPTTSTTKPTKPPAPAGSTLQPGDHGPAVLAVQQRLSALGYWLGAPDGRFGGLTSQAVFALQGAAGLTRDGVVGPATRKALERGALPDPRSGGTAIEIDLERGLVVFVRDGRPWRTLHTSTGSGRNYTYAGDVRLAHTPKGSYSVQRRIDGVRVAPLGKLYRPIYFYGGYAVHGSGSVPGYPASHGCARVSDAAIDMVWRENLMPHGRSVLVY